jgi:aldehyde dehydrogenase (NAD+)
VPTDLQKRFVDGVVDTVKGMTVGDPSDPETFIGPLVATRQQERVLSYLASNEVVVI